MGGISKRTVSLAAAVVLAAVATVSLIGYVRGVERRAIGRGETVEVFVAKDRIAEGASGETVVERKLVGLRALPRTVVLQGVIARLDEIRGKVAKAEIAPGEQILASRFVTPTRARGALPIPGDRQAMSIEVAPPGGVSGYVRAGDHVSVLARAGKAESGDTRVGFLLQNIEVLSVGRRAADGAKNALGTAGAGADKILLTLAVTAGEAEKLGYALLQGEIYVTLLPPGAKTSSTPGRTADSLFS